MSNVLYIRSDDDLVKKLDRIVALRRKAAKGTKVSRSDIARSYLHRAADAELKKLAKTRRKTSN